MHFKSASALLLTLGCCFSLPALAAADPLVGTWKTIDDRTGYSLSDVEISKGKDNHYSAKIINTRAVPGAAALQSCEKCAGSQKNMPLLGMTLLSGLTADPAKDNEFVGGRLLDPKSGRHYTARARLLSGGKHLVIHGRSGGAAVGRNLTWVKN
ncbi:DUF2147 domain-containing protein [Acinetobacter sp. WCHAc010034]|uniref:DUF2147 domain-containing protein n=1 Tax=Acinetobacter sp. WCHAc010034 TaxID=1879049 RepID=UPI00083B409A|nr:DUF2147 domain-containing protein [Acinetobacter sp. WCHAc010034]AYA03537.1 DUF2147 domain-containing protein [Acinetobacter sp. WCHAc010034]MBL8322329.1 DUF2147 domain-containing protein [Acinetobacter sp.]